MQIISETLSATRASNNFSDKIRIIFEMSIVLRWLRLSFPVSGYEQLAIINSLLRKIRRCPMGSTAELTGVYQHHES